jgi:putative GTP pyrophosphokinase
MDTFGVLVPFRASFQQPLNKVVMGLRSFVKSEMKVLPPDGKLPVGQRLKREPTIAGKLLRFPGMELARMQDIGGCRAIPTGGTPEVQGILRRIEKQWGPTIKGGKDYTRKPASTGYRAIHVVVRRDDRLIEIQLRTPGQQEWARAVERTELRTRFALKDGQGPLELLRYFELAAEGIALQEAGKAADRIFIEEVGEIQEQVRPYFERS